MRRCFISCKNRISHFSVRDTEYIADFAVNMLCLMVMCLFDMPLTAHIIFDFIRYCVDVQFIPYFFAPSSHSHHLHRFDSCLLSTLPFSISIFLTHSFLFSVFHSSTASLSPLYSSHASFSSTASSTTHVIRLKV